MSMPGSTPHFLCRRKFENKSAGPVAWRTR